VTTDHVACPRPATCGDTFLLAALPVGTRTWTAPSPRRVPQPFTPTLFFSGPRTRRHTCVTDPRHTRTLRTILAVHQCPSSHRSLAGPQGSALLIAEAWRRWMADPGGVAATATARSRSTLDRGRCQLYVAGVGIG
jgi:hypothetical protein